jgi:hypothetical protein
MRNMDKAIAIMKRAGRVDMGVYQCGYPSIKTEKIAHECGTAACFAGWIALSPEFQADGGTVQYTGRPQFDGSYGSQAIARWLDIGWQEAADLCMVGRKSYYDSANPSKEDVIEKLEMLIDEKH